MRDSVGKNATKESEQKANNHLVDFRVALAAVRGSIGYQAVVLGAHRGLDILDGQARHPAPLPSGSGLENRLSRPRRRASLPENVELTFWSCPFPQRLLGNLICCNHLGVTFDIHVPHR